MITDVEAGGDLFCFAQDQFARLVQAGALAKLGAKASEAVIAANDAGTVAAAMSGDTLYAYPLTSDNGYFMYYDKSVIPEEDVKSLEKLIADCEKAQKYFAFDVQGSAWYLAAFFFATGCRSDWTTDDAGTFIEVADTFNSPEGLIAVKGLKKLVDSPFFLSSALATEFSSNAAIVVSGTWDYETAKELLGDNLGVAELPSFEVDGKEYHLGSFNGCKLMGVKPQVDAVKGAVLHKLAQYLTGEKAQMERFEALSWGPSNLVDQASEAVQANPGLAALLAQAPYSVPQGQIHGSWWDIGKVITEDVKAAADEAGLQAALDNYYNKIAALFTLSDEVKNGWTVIGAICGTNWDTDFAMVKGDDGIWKSEALELHAGDEFKVRQGLSWDNNFPADNFKVEADGTYIITFDEAAGTVSLTAQ
jgi:arabinogalactan oligomer/maltooligosaccharide transport system substrate-binding protein